MKFRYVSCILVFISLFIISCDNDDDILPKEDPPKEQPTPEPEPDETVTDLESPAPIVNKPEIVIHHDAYIVSFNYDTMCPNYVAWHLTKERTEGTAERLSSFKVGPDLPILYQAKHSDYTNSGYDRGHMCPAADNKCSKEYMTQSFYMSNICPQTHNLNGGDGEKLEEKCREWVSDATELYIVSGPIYDDTMPPMIEPQDRRGIAIPSRFFKVILAVGSYETNAIGFIMFNDKTKKNLNEYAVTIDEVELITGFYFYHQMTQEQQNKYESQCAPQNWGL